MVAGQEQKEPEESMKSAIRLDANRGRDDGTGDEDHRHPDGAGGDKDGDGGNGATLSSSGAESVQPGDEDINTIPSARASQPSGDIHPLNHESQPTIAGQGQPPPRKLSHGLIEMTGGRPTVSGGSAQELARSHLILDRCIFVSF